MVQLSGRPIMSTVALKLPASPRTEAIRAVSCILVTCLALVSAMLPGVASASTSMAGDAAAAEAVYGQPDFASRGGCIERACTPATSSAFGLPFGVAVDAGGN